MPDDLLVPISTQPLSQGARVVDTFIAPSTTFADILRSASCWLPLLLLFLLTIGWTYSVDRNVGFNAVYEQQLSKSPKQEERMQSMPADQRAKAMAISVKVTRISSYASIIFVTIFLLIEALLLWASFNFGLGAATRFSQVFAVCVFASLPAQFVKLLLSGILLFAGVGTESFDLRNPVGTNLGYYLSDASAWMKTAGSFFDILGFWSLALLIIGMAIVSGKKMGQSAFIVMGWWALGLIIATGATAVFS